MLPYADLHGREREAEHGEVDPDFVDTDSSSTEVSEGKSSLYQEPPSRRDTHMPPPPAEPRSEEPVSDPDPEASGAGVEGGADAVPAKYSAFSTWEKRLIVLAASMAAFFSPLSAQIYLPALNVLSKDLHITSAQVNLTVTTYMIFQGITPMFIGGSADALGRRPAFIVCFIIYIAANVGLALSKSYGAILAVRCLQSAGSSSTVALAQAVVSDIVTSAERGQYIGITVLPIVLAPSLGPVLGGILSQYLGWQAIFWFLAISAGVMLIALLLFFPETCRNIVDDGSARAHPAYRTLSQIIRDAMRRRRARRNGDEDALSRIASAASQRSRRGPLKIASPNVMGSLELLFEKEMALLLGFSSLVFAGFYAIATSIPSQFARLYDFDDIIIGLMYLPMAAGSVIAAFVVGPAINWNYRRHRLQLGLPVDRVARSRQDDLTNFPIERARLEVGIPLLCISFAVLLCWGWTLQEGTSVAVPCVLLFLMGLGMIGFSNTTNVLLVDINPGRAGAAVAANNLTRCLLGAGASAAILPMADGMGIGWAFFLIGALNVMGIPILFALMRYGIQWRAQRKAKEERRLERRQAREQKKRQGSEEEEKEVAAAQGAQCAVSPPACEESSDEGLILELRDGASEKRVDAVPGEGIRERDERINEKTEEASAS